MSQTDPPEFEPDRAPALEPRLGLDPVGEPEDDLLRSSRFLDADLDPADQLAFLAEMDQREDLRQLVAGLRAASGLVRSPLAVNQPELDSIMASVLAELDQTERPQDPPVFGRPSHRARPTQRRHRIWTQALQLSAAAAVVVAIAVVAVSGGRGDDTGGGADSASESATFGQQRQVDEAVSAEISNEKDSLTDSTSATGNTPADLGGFTNVAELVTTLRNQAVPGSLSSTFPAAETTTTAASGTTFSDAQQRNPDAFQRCQITPPDGANRRTRSGGATVAGTPVLWTLWDGANGPRIIVLDTTDCIVLADQAL